MTHLNDIFTPRSRERYKGKLSLLYQQALQLQPTRTYKTPGDAFPEPVGQQELPENLRLEPLDVIHLGFTLKTLGSVSYCLFSC